MNFLELQKQTNILIKIFLKSKAICIFKIFKLIFIALNHKLCHQNSITMVNNLKLRQTF